MSESSSAVLYECAVEAEICEVLCVLFDMRECLEAERSAADPAVSRCEDCLVPGVIVRLCCFAERTALAGWDDAGKVAVMWERCSLRTGNLSDLPWLI